MRLSGILANPVRLALLLLAFTAIGADRFQLTTRSMIIPERGEVSTIVILMDTNQVSFMPPQDWRVRVAAGEKKVTVSHPNGSTVMSLKMVPEPSGKMPELNLESLRQQVKERFPDAKIIEEFTSQTGAGPGPAFDLQMNSATRVQLSIRLAFIPVPGFLLELNATIPSSQVKEWQPSLVNLVNSLRFEPLSAPK